MEPVEQPGVPVIEGQLADVPKAAETAAIKYAEDGDLDKIVKYTVNGQQVEKSVKEIMKEANLSQASWARFNEAASVRKEAEALKQRLLTDPFSVWKENNIDPKQFTFSHVRDEFAKSQMTPEQIKLIEREQQLAEREKALEEKDKSEKERAQQAIDQEVRGKVEEAVKQELIKNPDLPPTPQTIGRIAYYLEQAINNNIPATMEQIVDRVRKDLHFEHGKMYGGMDDEALMKLIGEDRIQKLVKSAAAKVKPAARAPIQSENVERKDEKKKGGYNPYTADRDAISMHNGFA